MKVTLFGVGYVGLVQGAVLASVGHDVVCIDIDSERVKKLNEGHIPIFEPRLESLLKENLSAKRLKFSTDEKFGVEHGDLIFIAVGTPPDEDRSADLSAVLNVSKSIATHMQSNKVVINKSTVPVGTAKKVEQTINEELRRLDKRLSVDIVSNPEFLKEGAAVEDCQRPDRIIIGTQSSFAEMQLRKLYAPFNRNHDKIIVMDIPSAELTKYAANCMLASKISFINEIANIAEKLGADIESVRHGIGSDPRIGYQFIYAGCGYGGSCFPKDVKALIQTSKKHGYNPQLLDAIEQVNNHQKNKLFDILNKRFNNDISGKSIAIWGLSFKPNTDDMREAPSRNLLESIWNSGAKVTAYDPESMEECQRIYSHRNDLTLCGTKEAAIRDADALIICTEWNQFKAPDFDFIKKSLKSPVIIDGRNLYDPNEMAENQFEYYGVGRGLSVISLQ